MAKKKTAKSTTRRGRPPSGPFWDSRRGQWRCNLAGKSHYAPRTIGETNVSHARKWYREVAKDLGVDLKGLMIEEGLDLPGTTTANGLQKLVVTLTSEVAADLGELDPMVAAEQLSATTNHSRTISVAIREALARRKAKDDGKG